MYTLIDTFNRATLSNHRTLANALKAQQKDAKRPSSLRLDLSGVPGLEIRDVLRGPFKQDMPKQVGDFVLRRADGVEPSCQRHDRQNIDKLCSKVGRHD
jgi:hypothetical protein